MPEHAAGRVTVKFRRPKWAHTRCKHEDHRTSSIYAGDRWLGTVHWAPELVMSWQALARRGERIPAGWWCWDGRSIGIEGSAAHRTFYNRFATRTEAEADVLARDTDKKEAPNA